MARWRAPTRNEGSPSSNLGRLDRSRARCTFLPGVPRDAARQGIRLRGSTTQRPAVHGVVLADQVKRADWQERWSEHIATVQAELLNEVRAKLKPLLGM